MKVLSTFIDNVEDVVLGQFGSSTASTELAPVIIDFLGFRDLDVVLAVQLASLEPVSSITPCYPHINSVVNVVDVMRCYRNIVVIGVDEGDVGARSCDC
jgi:hypothetical protein